MVAFCQKPNPTKLPISEQELLAIPQRQIEFVRVISDGIAAYMAGKTEIQKGSARPMRATAICRVMPSMEAFDWIGEIVTISTNSDGNGVFAVSIAPKILVMTWNNSLSDSGDGTLIKAGTPLYQSLLRLSVGDRITFSGNFLQDQKDCVRETSLTMEGSMLDPEFLFKFSTVEPLKRR